MDSSGNVVVTGSSFVTGIPGYDFTTIKYSPAGAVLWTRRYNGTGNSDDNPSAIAVDSAGNVFVTGSTTIGYSSSDVPLWTNHWGAGSIAVDRSGNVFVTGSSGTGTNSDFVTIKYSSSIAPPRLDFQTLNNQLVLSWTNANFTLQSAPVLAGTFTNVPAATSPYTNSLTGPQQFFRLISN